MAVYPGIGLEVSLHPIQNHVLENLNARQASTFFRIPLKGEISNPQTMKM